MNDLRLFQLISPNLPIGGFTYSQGLEWAVECGWVTDSEQLADWLRSVLANSMARFELPLLRQALKTAQSGDLNGFTAVAQEVVAGRETRELRAEERQRGAALAKLLPALDVSMDSDWKSVVETNQISGFAYAAAQWDLPVDDLCQGYLWAWLEGATVAGIKLVPLGQTQGQQLMLMLSPDMTHALDQAKDVPAWRIGASTFALALASAHHETQYTRLYRS